VIDSSYRRERQQQATIFSEPPLLPAPCLVSRQEKFCYSLVTQQTHPSDECLAITSRVEPHGSSVYLLLVWMINVCVPTERSRHIDIQHFVIQDWKDSGDIVKQFIHGVINPSGDLTKPLGWVLHERHARCVMGQC